MSVRLEAPTGGFVTVSKEKAERLKSQGWTPVDDQPAKKAPAKRQARKTAASASSEQ